MSFSCWTQIPSPAPACCLLLTSFGGWTAHIPAIVPPNNRDFYKIGFQWNWKLGIEQRDVLLGSLPNCNEVFDPAHVTQHVISWLQWVMGTISSVIFNWPLHTRIEPNKNPRREENYRNSELPWKNVFTEEWKAHSNALTWLFASGGAPSRRVFMHSVGFFSAF